MIPLTYVNLSGLHLGITIGDLASLGKKVERISRLSCLWQTAIISTGSETSSLLLHFLCEVSQVISAEDSPVLLLQGKGWDSQSLLSLFPSLSLILHSSREREYLI